MVSTPEFQTADRFVPEKQTVHQRIIKAYRIIAETDFVKSGKVGQGRSGYDFIPISSILAAVRKAHSEAGLYITIGELEYEETAGEYRGTVGKKKTNPVTGQEESAKWDIAIGHVTVTVHGADGDSVDMVVPFQSQDNSDKNSNKIITNIQRSVYRLLYSIDEGDGYDPVSGDPEAVNPSIVTRDDPFFAKKVYRDQPVPRRDA